MCGLHIASARQSEYFLPYQMKRLDLLKVIDKISAHYVQHAPSVAVRNEARFRTAMFLKEFPVESLPAKPEHEKAIMLEVAKNLGMLNLIDSEYLEKGLVESSSLAPKPSIFITGLPGTGSSLLQKLLSLDPASRTPLRYQVLSPLEAHGSIQERIATGTSLDDDGNRIGSKSLDPDEDLSILGYALYYFDFMTNIAADRTFTPELYKWITKPQTLDFQYKFHRRFAQLLNAQLGGPPSSHWVFSEPSHLGHMPLLRKVYPDSKVVFTHRRLANAVHGIVAQNVAICEEEEVPKIRVYNPRESLKPLVDAMGAALAYRRQLSGSAPGAFADVYFEELISHPIEIVSMLYASLGLTVSEEHRSAMRQWLDDNPMEINDYKISLEQCGYKNEADMNEHWKLYVACFPKIKTVGNSS